MPIQQLFIFTAGYDWVLAIPAEKEHTARTQLSVYLDEHPALRPMSEWRLRDIAGQPSPGVFSFYTR